MNVLRDQFPPVFRKRSYSAVVLENVTVGSLLDVAQFEAVDADQRGNMVYRVVGDNMAPVFFGLNADDKPFVVQPLTLAPNDQYLMRIEAYDSAYPDNKAEATININIIRLGVVNTTTDKTISENTGQPTFGVVFSTFFAR